MGLMRSRERAERRFQAPNSPRAQQCPMHVGSVPWGAWGDLGGLPTARAAV